MEYNIELIGFSNSFIINKIILIPVNFHWNICTINYSLTHYNLEYNML